MQYNGRSVEILQSHRRVREYLSPSAVFIDGTHIKVNANTKKQVKEQIPAAARHYANEMMDEVNADREAHGKKSFDDDNHPTSPKKPKDNTSKKLARRKKEKKRAVTKSVTAPDCGLFVKGEHKKQFAYEAHTACDRNGFVLETVITPGNVHDSVAFGDIRQGNGKISTDRDHCGRRRLQNAPYLQESLRRRESFIHSLQAAPDHERRTRVVESTTA